jgi:hypothetical protein
MIPWREWQGTQNPLGPPLVRIFAEATNNPDETLKSIRRTGSQPGSAQP